MASASDVAPSRRLGNLAMVFRHAAKYPLQITAAFTALAVTSAATIAIPYSFKRVIDRGFAAGDGSSAAADRRGARARHRDALLFRRLAR